MVQTCCIVSVNFCGIVSNKEGTVIKYILFYFITQFSVCHCKFKVFWSFAVCNFYCIFKLFNKDYLSAVINTLAGSCFCCKCFKLTFNFGTNFVSKIFVVCNKNRLSNYIVFCLCKKICCNPSRISRVVCNYHYFCRTGNKVNSNLSVK